MGQQEQQKPPPPDYGEVLDFGNGVKLPRAEITQEDLDAPVDYIDYDDFPPWPEEERDNPPPGTPHPDGDSSPHD